MKKLRLLRYWMAAALPLASLATLSGHASAQGHIAPYFLTQGAIVCKSQERNPICGSGTVLVTIRPDQTFSIQYGDNQCWSYGDTFYDGKASSSLPPVGDASIAIETFDPYLTLHAQRGHGSFGGEKEFAEPLVVGTLQLNHPRSAALLEIETDFFTMPGRSRYLLSCI